MSARAITELVQREPILLRTTDTVDAAVRRLARGRGCPRCPSSTSATATPASSASASSWPRCSPATSRQLRGAAFLRRSLDETLEKRERCRAEPVARHMNTEHVEVGPDFSDTQLAEIFLHHRVLIMPVVDDGRVIGVITRGEFFRTVAARFLGD